MKDDESLRNAEISLRIAANYLIFYFATDEETYHLDAMHFLDEGVKHLGLKLVALNAESE
jgi:hypothetical protein